MAGGSGDGSGSDLQLVPAINSNVSATVGGLGDLMKKSSGSGDIVEYKKSTVVLREEQEDIEVKLRRIMEHVPVRVGNTSGSSAGSGSGDFHQYRQMRRKEQDRLSRMDADYKKRKALAEFELRREERLKAEEEKAAKKRLKRQKKKQKKKEKKIKTNDGCEDDNDESDAADSDGGAIVDGISSQQ